MTVPSFFKTFFLSYTHAGSWVLWGTLQSGFKWHGFPSPGTGHKHPPAELPDYWEIQTSSWQGRQHEWRYLKALNPSLHSVSKLYCLYYFLQSLHTTLLFYPLFFPFPVASPDTSVSIFTWQVKAYGQGSLSTYIGVFDINRWYHAQMPDSLRYNGKWFQNICCCIFVFLFYACFSLVY